MGFRPRTEITSLFTSLMGRLTASLSGRLTAFLPQIFKAGGSRHGDGGSHGGEICWESRMLPLGCESLGMPQGVPLGTPHGVPSSRSQSRWVSSLRRGTHGGEICWESRMLPLGCESLGTPQGVPLGTPHGVPPPKSQSRWVPSSRRGCAHGSEICWESRKLPLGCESLGTPQGVPLGTPHGVPPSRSQSRWASSLRRGYSRWRDLLGKSDVTSWLRVSRDASGRPSRDASRRPIPQVSSPRRPVIVTGVLAV